MNIMIETCRQLSEALISDPLLLLASAVATFDPYWNTHDEEDFNEDPVHLALQVTRAAFPDVYAAAAELLREGTTNAEFDRLICGAITAKGIPLDDLTMISWGIPLMTVGVDLTEPEFYEAHGDLLWLLSLFGINAPNDNYSGGTVPEYAHDIGRALALSLHKQDDPALRQVGWLLGWLFSCTGNSLVDYTDEMLSELEPLSWSKDDVAFAIEMIAEADGIMADAMKGLAWLQQSPELQTALQRNTACVRQTGKKGVRGGKCIELEWPSAHSGTDGTSDVDTVVL
jgi:hypothetical protein